MRKAIVVTAVVLLAAGCGGGGGGTNNGSPSAGPTSTGSGGQANCVDLTSGPVFTLVQKNIAFHPKCFKARSAQSIHIVNEDSILHNFTIAGTQVNVDVQPGKFFNGESAGLKPGTYQFFCKFHKSSGMTGTVIVTG